jgi:hypothetical protein
MMIRVLTWIACMYREFLSFDFVYIVIVDVWLIRRNLL